MFLCRGRHTTRGSRSWPYDCKILRSIMDV
jgi:hypothetical protein